MPEFKAGGGFEPETYMEYFEDSDPLSNTEIGCKMPFLDGHYCSMGNVSVAPYQPITEINGMNASEQMK